MYNVKRQTKKFNTDETEEMAEYDEILNNPLCSIINERKEKLSNKTFDDEGHMSSIDEYVVLVVTWDEKVLA